MLPVNADWITVSEDTGDVCPVFLRELEIGKKVVRAELSLTALGVYEARINGARVGRFVLAPGWTAYEKRLQVQTYPVTELLRQGVNRIGVTVGRGWFRSPLAGWTEQEYKTRRVGQPCGLIGEMHIVYADGSEDTVRTGADWQWAESPVRFSEIYDGEKYDATFVPSGRQSVKLLDWSKEILIPQEGERVLETERVAARRILHTPAGETVVDFGQEITGYAEIRLTAKAGDRVRLLHGEVLDKNGNFYNANYRSAKAEAEYICRDGEQTWHPALTFFGFRYLKLAEYPADPEPGQFTAVVLCSELKRTGFLRSGVPELNRLFSNIFWGQKGNFLEVPTDCPQRDERLGWTGDAQVFCKAATYNYDVERFFRKWLRDLKADQRPDGEVGQVIPDVLRDSPCSSAWGDAAVIIPWQVYQTYGDAGVLEEQFDSMAAWVDYVENQMNEDHLWIGHFHYGDWLGLDSPVGSYTGATRHDFIANAFHIYAVRLLILAGGVIGRDTEKYGKLLPVLLAAFRKAFPACLTETELVLSVQFGIAEDPQAAVNELAERIAADGGMTRTGFLGTPYLLHVLSRFGHGDLAYSLLLRKEYPSWLYQVGKGATTVWEHWDGIMENGDFWSPDMNSFNHYAYGAVADWVYERAAGITPVKPGFAAVRVAPEPDARLGWLEASIRTEHGLVSSRWTALPEGGFRYEITAEMPAEIVIGGRTVTAAPGTYTFWSE